MRSTREACSPGRHRLAVGRLGAVRVIPSSSRSPGVAGIPGSEHGADARVHSVSDDLGSTLAPASRSPSAPAAQGGCSEAAIHGLNIVAGVPGHRDKPEALAGQLVRGSPPSASSTSGEGATRSRTAWARPCRPPSQEAASAAGPATAPAARCGVVIRCRSLSKGTSAARSAAGSAPDLGGDEFGGRDHQQRRPPSVTTDGPLVAPGPPSSSSRCRSRRSAEQQPQHPRRTPPGRPPSPGGTVRVAGHRNLLRPAAAGPPCAPWSACASCPRPGR